MCVCESVCEGGGELGEEGEAWDFPLCARLRSRETLDLRPSSSKKR